ncbi:hypothetical protein [Parasitella parasitica]|uniref:Uncharacterized protein n=1 Tax=Parasitella parasitica TaxID=35722 RepID=A0A0B7N9X9_9FUNG|nr:hypothetical protein [Parasitella parasitica]
MAEESTLPALKTVEEASNDTPDSLLNQLVKQEGENGALVPHPDFPNKMKLEQDTIMIEATSTCRDSKDNDALSVKLETIEAKALKDDTPVEPSASPSLLSSDAFVEAQQQLPSLQQQQQKQQPSPQPQQSSVQSEPHPLITTNTASMPTTASDIAITSNSAALDTSPSITKNAASSTPDAVTTKSAEIVTSNGTIQSLESVSAQAANDQAAKKSTEDVAANGSTAQAPTSQTTAATPTQTSRAPPSQATTSLVSTATPSAPAPTSAPLTAPSPTPTTTFEEIQKQLKNTLDHVEQRNMVSGFQTLSKATSAVVDHCEQLGLTSDDHPYNAIDREQFWAGLNNCWLYALAQRHEPSSDAERLTDQHLYGLRDMVVSWADKLERFGLVDYEMGWWEADILAAIDGILAMNYAAAQAAAQAVVAQAAAALFGEDVNM